MMDDNAVANKSGAKKFIIFGVLFLVVILAIVGVVVLVSQSSNGQEVNEPIVEKDAEQVEYDSKDENTGGEESDIPANESLDFLKEYLSEDDILYVENEIHVTVNNYYPQGYNSIVYDLDSVKIQDPGYQLVFDFRTDVKDRSFHMTIQLNSENKVVSSLIESK